MDSEIDTWGYIADDRAESSRAKYARCWAQFIKWLAQAPLRRASKLPVSPHSVSAYINSLQARELAKSTILVHVAAIGYAHEIAGLQAPWLNAHRSARELRQTIRALRRRGHRDVQSRLPIEREHATEIVSLLRVARTITERRDRAIFCVTWLTALRRSNIAAMRRRDIEILTDPIDSRRYLKVFVPQGDGRNILVSELPGDHPLCAVRAMLAFLDVARIEADEPVFQSVLFRRRAEDQQLTGRAIDPSDVARIVKRMLKRAGVDPTHYSAHSLRRGFAISMQKAGIPDAIVMDHGGWKSKDNYHRDNRLAKGLQNPVRDLFG